MKWQSGDFSNEFHRAAAEIIHSSLLKCSFLHEFTLGCVCTKKALHREEGTQSCTITGGHQPEAQQSPLRQPEANVTLVCNTRAQKSHDLGTRESCPFCSPYERGTRCSESSDRTQFLAEMPLLQLSPHICAPSLPQQASARIVFLLHNRNQLD